VYALAALDNAAMQLGSDADIEVRPAKSNDRELVAGVFNLIRSALARPPTWAAALPEHDEEVRAGYAGLVDEADATVWLAFMGGQVVGVQAWYAETPSPQAMLVGEHCVKLNLGATVEHARGRGVTRALMQAAVAFERARGMRVALTDWRSANVLAARAWPRFGFQPAMLRLHRRVDERIAWARPAN
jgi:GNAT superfamily N-acetyltransferase